LGVLLIGLAWSGAIGAWVYWVVATFSIGTTDSSNFKDWVFAELGRAAGFGVSPQGWPVTMTALVEGTDLRLETTRLQKVPAGTTLVTISVDAPRG
jgi:hypothetical protein